MQLRCLRFPSLIQHALPSADPPRKTTISHESSHANPCALAPHVALKNTVSIGLPHHFSATCCRPHGLTSTHESGTSYAHNARKHTRTRSPFQCKPAHYTLAGYDECLVYCRKEAPSGPSRTFAPASLLVAHDPLTRAKALVRARDLPKTLPGIPLPRTHSQGILTRLPSLQCQGIFLAFMSWPMVKVPPREHFVPKGFSKSFLPNSSGYGVIPTKNLAIPAHKDGSKNTSNQVFHNFSRCQTTLTNTPILVRGSF
jgi:hypothetical protein